MNCVFVVIGHYQECDFGGDAYNCFDILFAFKTREECEAYLNNPCPMADGYDRLSYQVCDVK